MLGGGLRSRPLITCPTSRSFGESSPTAPSFPSSFVILTSLHTRFTLFWELNTDHQGWLGNKSATTAEQAVLMMMMEKTRETSPPVMSRSETTTTATTCSAHINLPTPGHSCTGEKKRGRAHEWGYDFLFGGVGVFEASLSRPCGSHDRLTTFKLCGVCTL